jgi:hypothetical protein
MLIFKSVTIEDKEILRPYLTRYGSSSCQHSLILMTGLSMKYGDEYAIADDVLYVHRSALDSDGERFYLAPLGEYDVLSPGGEAKFRRSVDLILEDASEHGCKAVFYTATEEFKALLETYYPAVFEYEYSRDYAEYVYSAESLKILPGKALRDKRNRVRAFYSAYEGHVRIENITEENMTDVMVFQMEWIKDRLADNPDELLAREHEAIKFYLSHFEELEMTGIVVYVRGTVVGYAAGVALNDDCMDEVIEKGRKDITGIYQLLCNEFALLCCGDCKYINREEDLGVEGLRRAKTSYCPEYMIEKYVVKQI